ncbi:antibiotic biosynthesis monooxygenase [Cohnella terricola]|nr:antibiotic biosynthesis monooxygenase [Cohnella terricola]
MIVVENRIEVKAGFGVGVIERFRTPKSVHTFPGFVRMDVLHSTNESGNEEVRVCTTWEKEEDFQAWSNSDSFRHAHAKRAEAAASRSEEEAANNPILGNKVTIYQVAVTHLPQAAVQV